MTNDDFKVLWDVLNGLYAKRSHDGNLTELHHGGKIDFARRVQEDLDKWCDEVVARAKGEFEQESRNFDALREAAGDRFDAIEPDHLHGLKFEAPKRGDHQ